MLALSKLSHNKHAQECIKHYFGFVRGNLTFQSRRQLGHSPLTSGVGRRLSPPNLLPESGSSCTASLLQRFYHTSKLSSRQAKPPRRSNKKQNQHENAKPKQDHPHRRQQQPPAASHKNGSRNKNGSHTKNNPQSKKKQTTAPQKKRKPAKIPVDWDKDIRAPNGRLIFTKAQHLQNHSVFQQLRIDAQNCKNLVHNVRQRMKFANYSVTHDIMGPEHDQMFVVKTNVTLENAKLLFPGLIINSASLPPGAIKDDEADTIQLQATGLARRKREAETMSLLDLSLFFYQLGINVRDPPNLQAILRENEREQFRAELRKAVMLLELCRAWRVSFDTGISRRSQHRAEISLFVGRHLIQAEAVAGNRADAKGRAIVEASQSTSFRAAVGKDRLEEYQRLIDTAPAGQVAPMYVAPLPDEWLERFMEVMDDFEQEKRLEDHAAEREAFEESIRNRRQDLRRSQNRHCYTDKEKQDINGKFAREEEERERKALEKPDGTFGRMKAVREALPIRVIREQLLEQLKSKRVVVLSGGTGSGKSTQCPQYILEDSIAKGKGAETRILVTQPRRIAAISVAERVAAERGERVGNSVGYTVRFNRAPARDLGGSIDFVTTGVLMRRIVNDPQLDGISHIMIDEVHERDIDTDFLLVLLKDLMKRRPDLRVVLMSATLDAESFASYFSQESDDLNSEDYKVPLLSVPTHPRYPVRVFHLEDLAGESNDGNGSMDSHESLPDDIREVAASLLAIQDQQLQLELEEAEEEEKATLQIQARVQSGAQLDSDSDSDSSGSDSEEEGDTDDDELVPRSTSAAQTQAKAEKLRTAASMRSLQLDLPLQKKSFELKRELGDESISMVVRIAQHITQVETDAGRKGSILCFLPGWDEIKAALDILEDSPRSLRRRMLLLPLHSSVPKEEQHKVFEPAEDGVVKIILATNIAESSVTINDVLAVVDCGLVRELQYDAEKAMTIMETVPTSRASATQRLGRAGRVAPGTCYRLYSRAVLHAMSERPVPEIHRTALEATCLQTCSMTNGRVADFLRRALDPPSDESVSLAMQRLVNLGAISVDRQAGEETLTPLGRRLVNLPLDPGIGRMLIMGCVMNCLGPVLTAAACYSSKVPFYSPPGMRAEARAIQKSFSESSDLMATVAAYNKFRSKLLEEGWGAVREWAGENFISIHAMNSIHSLRAQLLHELNRTGFVSNSDIFKARDGKKYLVEDAAVNQNGDISLLVAAIWSTGLPGNLAVRRSRLSNFGTFLTSHEENAALHPSSVAFHRSPPGSGVDLPKWFLYQEMVLSSQVFLRGCTAVRPEQILLFGGYSLKEQDTKRLILDDWIVAESQCKATVSLFASARRELNIALEKKVMRPKLPLPETTQSILDELSAVLEDIDSSNE